MKTYLLPKEIRPELRKIWGFPIFGPKAQVLRKFKEFLKDKAVKEIITVGDCCSLNFPSDIKIFDGKINEKKVNPLPKFGGVVLNCQNSPGRIQKEVWPIIKRAIKNKENVFVEGEEDLLVIPAVLLSQKNSLVVYGFPGKGICAIEISSQVKKNLKELLKKFQPK